MATKTVYITDPDLWKRAARLIRFYEDASLSRHLENHLREIVAKYEKENPHHDPNRPTKEATGGGAGYPA